MEGGRERSERLGSDGPGYMRTVITGDVMEAGQGGAGRGFLVLEVGGLFF